MTCGVWHMACSCRHTSPAPAPHLPLSTRSSSSLPPPGEPFLHLHITSLGALDASYTFAKSQVIYSTLHLNFFFLNKKWPLTRFSSKGVKRIGQRLISKSKATYNRKRDIYKICSNSLITSSMKYPNGDVSPFLSEGRQAEDRVGKCHRYDGYIRVKKLANSGKNLGRTKNKPLFGRFVQQV